jgi:hypothetical protein
MKMSIEDLFVTDEYTPTINGVSQRRVWLLKEILPNLTPAISQAAYRDIIGSNERMFWLQLLGPCVAMETSGWNFNRLDDRKISIINSALQSLGKIVQIEKTAINEVRSLSSSADSTHLHCK